MQASAKTFRPSFRRRGDNGYKPTRIKFTRGYQSVARVKFIVVIIFPPKERKKPPASTTRSNQPAKKTPR